MTVEKTCGACEKGTVSGCAIKDESTVKSWVRCSVTGKEHVYGHPCDVPDKPRLCAVLGVEVGERFRVPIEEQAEPIGPFWVSSGGGLIHHSDLDTVDVLCALIAAINHPEKIMRVPRLTDKERDICRLLGAKWVSRAVGSDLVKLWKTEPEPMPGGYWDNGEFCAMIFSTHFPSVQPGQLIQVEDAT